MTSQDVTDDELPIRLFLHRTGARPFGHRPPPPVTCSPPAASPEEPDMLFALLLAGLAPGLATAWLLRGRGWPLAGLAGLGVTATLPCLLAATLLMAPPLGIAVAAGAGAAALRAYDDGRVWTGTAWAATAVAALACAGVAL